MATIEAARASKPKLPELPADSTSGVVAKYHPMTLVWWDTVWSSPISDEWVDADVPGLVALARLVDNFWAAPRAEQAKLHAEVRMASQQFGLSPFSRRQLQWEVKRVEGAKPKTPERPRTRKSNVLSILEGRSA